MRAHLRWPALLTLILAVSFFLSPIGAWLALDRPALARVGVDTRSMLRADYSAELRVSLPPLDPLVREAVQDDQEAVTGQGGAAERVPVAHEEGKGRQSRPCRRRPRSRHQRPRR